MRFTIFYRLVFGYLAIILIMGAMDAYTVAKLHRLSKEASRILDIDERVLELKQKISGSLISQSGYGRKYLITRDLVFRDQFLACERDFKENLVKAISLADTAEKRASLALIESRYNEYQSLVNQRMESVRKGQGPLKDGQVQEEEKAVEQILTELKTLETLYTRGVSARMRGLRDTADSATKVTLLMVAMAVVLAVGTSVAVTRSITGPLKVLMEKTKEVSRGIFAGGLHIKSPPEVSELARTFDVMCEKLSQVDKIKSEFFSTISHELRTPLTAIGSGIVLLRQGLGGLTQEKRERLLTILSEESGRLIGLVDSVLDLSKMEAGMMAYHFREEQLIFLVEQVVAEMTPLFEAKKIHLETDLAKDAPLLQLDRERILQALRNLIGNALKFTPQGGRIWISAGPGDGVVKFSVKDMGPGIPAESLDVIFEKFHQFSGGASEKIKGTGLGLAIVKRIIISHGGKVWAESEAGRGSVFTFTLPV